MKRLLTAVLFFLAFVAAALAQNVTVIGPVTPGNIAQFNSTTVIKDSGLPAASSVNGPATSTLNGLPLWANTTGNVLLDGAGQTIAGNYTWSGSQSFTNTNAFAFGTGSNQTIRAGSANTGFNNALQSANSGTSSTSGTNAQLTALLTGCANCFEAVTVLGGASPSATLSTGAGMIGGFTISAGAGNLNIASPNLTGTANATGTFQIGGVTLALPVSIGNGGTGHVTAPAAISALMPTPTRAGDVVFWNGSNWVTLAGNNSGTQILSENASGVPAWTSAGAGSVQTVTPGGGLVSSTTANCSQGNITVNGTLSKAECVNAQVGTSYAIADSDRAKLITGSNAAAQAYTIAQAGTASNFFAGWYTDIINNSTNPAGIIQITATTSLFNLAGTTSATLNIYPGQSYRIVSDGTNYQVIQLNISAGPVLLNTITASASANISDTTSLLTAGFSTYRLEIINLIPATTSTSCEIQVQSGGSFQALNYVNASTTVNTAGNASPAPTTYIACGSNAHVANNGSGVNGYCEIKTPSVSTAVKPWNCFTSYSSTTGSVEYSTTGGFWNGGTGAITGFQALFSSGNITSGQIKIYGII